MTFKLTYEELEQRVRELEKQILEMESVHENLSLENSTHALKAEIIERKRIEKALKKSESTCCKANPITIAVAAPPIARPVKSIPAIPIKMKNVIRYTIALNIPLKTNNIC